MYFVCNKVVHLYTLHICYNTLSVPLQDLFYYSVAGIRQHDLLINLTHAASHQKR